jgi:uncharacterized membrane protein YccC
MTSPYRPSPFTSHPTVVMPDTKSEPPASQAHSQSAPKQKAVRYGLYVALALAILYAVWTWTR